MSSAQDMPRATPPLFNSQWQVFGVPERHRQVCARLPNRPGVPGMRRAEGRRRGLALHGGSGDLVRDRDGRMRECMAQSHPCEQPCMRWMLRSAERVCQRQSADMGECTGDGHDTPEHPAPSIP